MIYCLILPLSALLLSLSGTALSIPFLKSAGIIDNPTERSNHKAPVPRGGGLAMVICMLLLFMITGADSRLIFAAILLAVISFTDDMRGVSVQWRLMAQIIAVVLSLSVLHGRLFPEFIPIIFEWIFIAFFWLWFINLTNFMDGIDGITSLQVIVMAVGICFVSAISHMPYELSGYALIVAGATLGFFWFNRTPARLFMGDVGSITLGFIMGYLLLQLAVNGGFFSALILPAYYLSDATFTLGKRLLRREKVWQAHSEHAYQQAVRSGLTHMQVVRKITILNVVLVVLAMLATLNMIAGVIMLIIAYAITACFIKRLLNAKAFSA